MKNSHYLAAGFAALSIVLGGLATANASEIVKTETKIVSPSQTIESSKIERTTTIKKSESSVKPEVISDSSSPAALQEIAPAAGAAQNTTRKSIYDYNAE